MHNAIRVPAIVRFTLLAHLLTQLILYKAWTTNRIFPTLTVFAFTKNLPEATPLILYCANLLVTLIVFWKPLWRFGIGLWIGLIGLTWAWDYVLWQPYTYFFLAIIVIHFFSKTHDKFWIRCLLLLSALYLYSGLHKINGAFLYAVWDSYFLKKCFAITPSSPFFLGLHYAGLIVGLIEVAFGLGLLFQRSRLWAFRGLVVMHLLIILGLSPIGLFSNNVVLPWNFALLFLNAIGCFGLTLNSIAISLKEVYQKQFWYIFTFWLLPFIGFLGYYNQYFSFNVYSGKGKTLYRVFDNPQDCPKSLIPFLSQRKIENQNRWVVSPTSWCKSELQLLLPNDAYVLDSFTIAYRAKFPKCSGQWYVTRYPYTDAVSHWMDQGYPSNCQYIENLQKKQ